MVCNDLNSAANVDDDHCAYPGCTSSERIDYDPIATIDDGLCVPPVPGCTCSLSANFDRQARRRASIAACMDPRAYSYDERAQVHIQDECLYFKIGCTDKDAINFQSWATFSGLPTRCVYPVYGCTSPRALNYNPKANRLTAGACWWPYTARTDK